MKRTGFVAAGLGALLVPITPARACRMHVPIVLADVRYAQLVLVGRVSNYTIVRDEALRQKMLANPTLSPDLRRLYRNGAPLLGDYARFEVAVDELLAGKAPRRITVTWDNSTFGEPANMPAGLFLMALRDPAASAPPLRGPSATILPNREPGSLTLLQAPCSDAFLFDAKSEEARTIRETLHTQHR